MLDGSSYGFVVELDGPDLVKDDNTRQSLVQRMKKLPSKVTTIKNDSMQLEVVKLEK